MLNIRFWVLVGITLVVAGSRLLPHPPNVSPVAALALFAGACFTSKRAAFAVPLVAMLLSDLVILLGLTETRYYFMLMPFVYGSFVLATCLGLWIGARRPVLRIATATLGSSVLFFVVTNFGAWLAFYPLTWDGLVQCFVLALPFFRNSLAGDAFFSLLFFGGFALAEYYIAALRVHPGPASNLGEPQPFSGQ
jgi:hypothetical protein